MILVDQKMALQKKYHGMYTLDCSLETWAKMATLFNKLQKCVFQHGQSSSTNEMCAFVIKIIRRSIFGQPAAFSCFPFLWCDKKNISFSISMQSAAIEIYDWCSRARVHLRIRDLWEVFLAAVELVSDCTSDPHFDIATLMGTFSALSINAYWSTVKIREV